MKCCINYQVNYFAQGILHNATMWLRGTGVLNKLKDGFLSREAFTPLPKVRHRQPLILRQLGIMMIVLVVGLSIGPLVFVVELCTGGSTKK